MELHFYTRELLDKHLLPELKEIARSIGIVPDGNKTRRETWVVALTGQPFPIFQTLEPIAYCDNQPIETPPGVENIQAQEPIETSIDAEKTQDPIALSDLDAALAEIARLRAENAELLQQVRSHKQTITEAKDITPVQRCSFIRVLKLARAACLDLSKSITGGWVLSLGTLQRTFKSLYEIWRLLVVGEWNLSDLFNPPEKVPTPSPDAFSHNRVVDWFAALGKVGLESEPLEAAQSRRSAGRFAAIPFAEDELIDSYALGFAGAGSSGRSPPDGGDAML
ncbi:hypothetical protein [Microcoleus sp. AT9b-C3]|uniref:hypothetical protein n=1 Tax=Microcoleus sp. AT9b-C3 TaxID=2818629 RepID=UPI002FD0F24A